MSSNVNLRAIILSSMEDSQNDGNTYINENDLFNMCKHKLPMLTYKEFVEESNIMIKCNDIFKVEDKYYLYETFEDEAKVASFLANLLNDNKMESTNLNYDSYYNVSLCEEQIVAMKMVNSHRLSLITGGPGTGKSATRFCVK